MLNFLSFLVLLEFYLSYVSGHFKQKKFFQTIPKFFQYPNSLFPHIGPGLGSLYAHITDDEPSLIKRQEAHWTASPVKQYLLHGFFLPKGINNRENFGGFQPKRLFFSQSSLQSIKSTNKKAQRKNLVQVKYKQDKPKVSTFEYTIWALGCDNHTVSGSVFSVSSYILVLR